MAYVGTPRYLGSDQATLASIIQGEAGNQGRVGMQAVGAVIANRAASNFSGYGNDVMSQALARNQFQGQSTGYSAQAYEIAGNVLNGTNPDPTGGATSYANPGQSSASWARNLNPQNSLQIGDHFFTDNQNGVPFTPNFSGSGAVPQGPADTSSGLPAGSGASGGGSGDIIHTPEGDFIRTDPGGAFAGATPGATSGGASGIFGTGTGSATAGTPGSSGSSSTGGEGKPTAVIGVSNTFYSDLNKWISDTLNRFGQAFKSALTASENSIATFFGGIANWFIRGFLIILGAILIILALIAITGRSAVQIMQPKSA